MAVWTVGRTLNNATAVLISTTAVAFVTGFLLGIYSIRGYLLSPAFVEERRRNLTDPVESDESDVDDGTILDHAPNWTNGEEADIREGLRATKKAKSNGKPTNQNHTLPSHEECKLVLIVRTDLGMTKGKIAAQCGHATLSCYKSLRRIADRDPSSSAQLILQRWEHHGQAKIAVQAKGQDTLLELMNTARSLGLTAETVVDAGRTQIEPGSLTVVGVGPAPKSLVDKVTGGLKLL